MGKRYLRLKKREKDMFASIGQFPAVLIDYALAHLGFQGHSIFGAIGFILLAGGIVLIFLPFFVFLILDDRFDDMSLGALVTVILVNGLIFIFSLVSVSSHYSSCYLVPGVVTYVVDHDSKTFKTSVTICNERLIGHQKWTKDTSVGISSD